MTGPDGGFYEPELPGILESGVELLSDVAADEQGDEGTHGRVVEPCHNVPQALVDGMRIEPAVELLVDNVRDVA